MHQSDSITIHVRLLLLLLLLASDAFSVTPDESLQVTQSGLTAHSLLGASSNETFGGKLVSKQVNPLVTYDKRTCYNE